MSVTITKSTRFRPTQYVAQCPTCSAKIGTYHSLTEARSHEERCPACRGEPDPIADHLALSLSVRKLKLDIARVFPGDEVLLGHMNALESAMRLRVAGGSHAL